MADRARLKPPQIKPGVADQLLVACLVVIALEWVEDDDHLAVPVGVLKHALPLTSQSERMQRLRLVAEDIVAAAPGWRNRTVESLWEVARNSARRALKQDALTRVYDLAGL